MNLPNSSENAESEIPPVRRSLGDYISRAATAGCRLIWQRFRRIDGHRSAATWLTGLILTLIAGTSSFLGRPDDLPFQILLGVFVLTVFTAALLLFGGHRMHEAREARITELESQLTPPESVARCLDKLANPEMVLGRYGFTPLWALGVIRDHGGFLPVIEIPEVAADWNDYAWEENKETAIRAVGPLVRRIPRQCVENRPMTNGDEAFRITPFGVEVLLWAKLTGLSTHPSPR